MYYCVIETTQGHVALVGDNGVLTHSTLPKPSPEAALAALDGGLDGQAVEDIAAFGDLPGKLMDYFEGKPVDFADVQVDLGDRGAFHKAVLRATQRIPYGTLVTYGDLARMAGSPGAARAAGCAMAGNTMLIVVPCHRVVAAGGKIGGFGCGLEWKRSLLRLEGIDI